MNNLMYTEVKNTQLEKGKVRFKPRNLVLEPKVLSQCCNLPAKLIPFYSFYPNLPLVRDFPLPAPAFKSVLIFRAYLTLPFL